MQMLAVFFGIAIFIMGIVQLSKNAFSKSGKMLAASGLVAAIVIFIAFYKDAVGVGILSYPLLLGLLVAAGLCTCLIVITCRRNPIYLFISLFNTISGAVAVLLAVYSFKSIVAGGILFPADEAEGLPGFVFIFGNFGHQDILIFILAMVAGCLSVTSGLVSFIKWYGKSLFFRFKWQPLINMILLLMLIGYCVFVVWQTPVTTTNFGFALTATNGLKARAGLYDIHFFLFYSTLPLAFFCVIFFTLPFTGEYIVLQSLKMNVVACLVIAILAFAGKNQMLGTASLLFAVACILLVVLLHRKM